MQDHEGVCRISCEEKYKDADRSNVASETSLEIRALLRNVQGGESLCSQHWRDIGAVRGQQIDASDTWHGPQRLHCESVLSNDAKAR